MMRGARYQLVALASGVLFGVGLVISGMTDPRKVLGFLDVAGHWDPSLLFVMVGAIAVHALAYRAIRGRSLPWLADRFMIPTRRDIDPKLLAGAAIFGVGWGLSGYCPGPAIVSMAAGGVPALVFVIAMVAGMIVAAKLDSLLTRSARDRKQAA